MSTAGGADGRIEEINFPSTASEGSDITIEVTIANTTNSDWQYGLTLDSTGTGKQLETIAANSQQTYQLTHTLNEEVDADMILHVVDATGFLVDIDTERVIIGFEEGGGTGDLSGEIVQIGFADELCQGDNGSVILQTKNTSDSTASFRVTFEETKETIAPREDAPGNGSIWEFNFIIENSINSRVVVEATFGNGWKVVATSGVTIDMRVPDVIIQEASFPTPVLPGEGHTGIVLLENQGNCESDFKLTSSSLNNKQGTMQPGETREFSYNFTITSQEQTFNFTLSADAKDDVQISRTVKAHSAALINSDGDTTFLGAEESKLNYNALVQATDLESNQLEDSDTSTVGPLRKAGLVQLSSDSYQDPDVLSYSNLDYLNVEAGEEVVWVLDGKVQETSSSFEYSTFLSGMGATRDKPAQNPDTSAKTGLSKHVGRLANRVSYKFRR